MRDFFEGSTCDWVSSLALPAVVLLVGLLVLYLLPPCFFLLGYYLTTRGKEADFYYLLFLVMLPVEHGFLFLVLGLFFGYVYSKKEKKPTPLTPRKFVADEQEAVGVSLGEAANSIGNGPCCHEEKEGNGKVKRKSRKCDH